jgi:hypothetical protein
MNTCHSTPVTDEISNLTTISHFDHEPLTVTNAGKKLIEMFNLRFLKYSGLLQILYSGL